MSTSTVGPQVGGISYVKQHAARNFGVAALTIGFIFGVVFVAPLPLWAGQPVPVPTAPNASEPIGWPGAALVLIFAVGLTVPFRPYWGALNLASRIGSWRLVVLLTFGLATTALLVYPRFGSDIFDYVGFERMWVVYGDNPLLATPASHPADWSTPLVWFARQPPAYGPLWALLTWPIVRLAGDSPALAVLGYKLLSATAYAACCGLIVASVEPARRKRALVLFAWSPLVLFEALGKVHNDVLIALGMLGAVFLVGRGGRAQSLSLVVSVATGVIKATALTLAPLLAMRQWRHSGWRGVAVPGAAATALTAAVYAPFWAGLATFQPLLSQTGRLVWSPGTLLILLGRTSGDGRFDVPVRVTLFAVWLAVMTWVLSRRSLNSRMLIAANGTLILLSSLLLLSTAMFAHYLVPAVALAAVSGSQRLERLVLWLSIGSLAAYAVELLDLAIANGWIGSVGYQLAGSALTLGPALLAELLSLTRPGKQHARV